MRSRKQIVQSLIAFEKPLQEIQKELSLLEWDTDEYVTTLTRQDILSILHRYLNNELTAEEVRDWAEELDGREDYAQEKGYRDLIIEILERLSTEPRLGLPLTPEYARKLIEEITSARFNKNEEEY